MRICFRIMLFICLFVTLSAAESFQKGIPDINGYKTLVGDFHLHTVFSDGLVWPSFRIDEAAKEGLDVIAVTDHIDYLPHKSYLTEDKNASYNIARKRGILKNILVIPGIEFTKWMPPGHFNALFIKDANALTSSDFLSAMQSAIDQNAFITWNHPGWRVHQPDGVVRWYDIHETLDEKGWIHGIEYANHHSHYPKVMEIAQERDYTIFANSDVHGIVSQQFKKVGHRPVTFVFAQKRSLESIREALDAGRTLGYFNHTLVGKSENIIPFMSACLEIENNGKITAIKNLSQIPFTITVDDKKEKQILPAYGELDLNVAGDIHFKNVITGRSSHYVISL